jgi:hypothetical protein
MIPVLTWVVIPVILFADEIRGILRRLILWALRDAHEDTPDDVDDE